MTVRNFAFGDTGGHSEPLFAALKKIGIDLKKFTIPEGVRIIHCGDLIHKGPDSTLLLKTVDKLIKNNPNQWIQILGNHEFQHLEGSPYFWRCKCSLEDVGIIEDWFESGLAVTAFGINKFSNLELEVSDKPKIFIPDKGILFTHGGLTNFWWHILDKPSNAFQAAQRINQLPVDVVTSPGLLMGVQNFRVGPVWAIGNEEVFKSWLHQQASPPDELPFILIHGHTTSYNFVRNEWWDKSKSFMEFRNLTKLNPQSRAVITRLASSLMIGIDPGFNMHADLKIQPSLAFLTPF